MANRCVSVRECLDYHLIAQVMLLLGFGLVMVYSSSVGVAEKSFGEPEHYFERQAIFIGVSLSVSLIAWWIPLARWERLGPAMMAISAVLLIAVLMPGVGREINGSWRWIPLGVANLQPSELVKLAVVVYLAGYLVRHSERVVSRVGGFVMPMLLLGVLVLLLLLEPDFGAVVVLVATAMGMMFLAGVRIWLFGLVMLPAVVGLGLMVYLSPYRLERLTGFLDPWKDPTDTGYQLTQALIAYGRGDWLGVGLGDSVQKLFYLPEAHTDFVFSVLAEELGLIGSWSLIALFGLFIWHCFGIARRALAAQMMFAMHLAHGLTLWLAFQVVINLGVNMGLLPTKGLTLPFMSYGGSSLLSNLLAVVLLLRIDYEVRRSAPQRESVI